MGVHRREVRLHHRLRVRVLRPRSGRKAQEGQGRNQRFVDGPTVLRGLMELRDNPITRGRGDNQITLLGEIRMLPLPE